MKELLQQKAEAYSFQVPFDGTNHFYDKDKYDAFLAGAKEILDNPELYGLVKKDLLDELERKNESLRSSLSASERFRIEDAAEHLDDNLLLRKENKELKEKVTELEKRRDELSIDWWKLKQQVNELLFMAAFTKFGAEQYLENWKPKIITNTTNSNY